MRRVNVTAAAPIHSCLIATILLMALTFAASAQEKLVGVTAWNALVGNSISGMEDGEVLVEYYAPDGTAKSMLGNEIVAGKWALVGETVCFQYSDDKDMECYKVEVTGNSATFIAPNGTGSRYEILKGNPKGL
jgi:hypothetical protein